MRGRRPVRLRSYFFVYLPVAAFLLLAHGPLLALPYYWDELGQFVPASLDMYRAGRWIARSTLPNVHPPGVMAYLAFFWHVFGYSIEGTRVAMLLLAALGAFFTFLLAIELARGTTGAPAFAALSFLAVSPLFFAQSMLVELDMPAMCFTALALLLFLQNRFRASALACVALVLAKETGIVAPAIFGIWLMAERRIRQSLWYVLPLAALCLWLAVLKQGTGHWFGNQAFTEYNVFYPLNPVRFSLALLRRMYYLFIGTGHFIGTLALIWAIRRVPVFRDRGWRVAATLAAAQVLAVTALGGAVLERYLLPVLPILYIAFAIAIGSLAQPLRKPVLGALLACLILGNFINPLYSFPFENNLMFVSFVDLEREAAADIEQRPGRIATTFPMADALRRPLCGFVSRARSVVELADFRRAEIPKLREAAPEMVVVYDTAWDPLGIQQWALPRLVLRKYYDYEPPMTPAEFAQTLSMHVARRWEKRGLSMTLLVRDAANPL
jgi:4-amino-4-deoxy-L-arabinose transferase-like glycosyltransferase